MFRCITSKWKHLGPRQPKRLLSTTSIANKKYCCKLLIVGGGTGGCNLANRFSRVLCKNEIILIEPSEVHYYQPDFTFVGAGVKKLRDCVRATIELLPENIIWLQDEVAEICPHVNTVLTKGEDTIEYDFMIVAMGITLDFNKVAGLPEALENYRNVCTIFSPRYAEKTFKCLREFVNGTALFTAPRYPTKCVAASFKICFIAEDYFRRNDKLEGTDITYTAALKNIFPVKEYETTILGIVKRKRIDLHLQTNLVEVIPDKNKAVFECLANPGKRISMEYTMLHVSPPMCPPDVLQNCKELVNKYKYMDVDLNTLQHKKYPNVFAVGDCTPGKSNKTASAIGAQSFVVFQNLSSVMCGQKPTASYDGYTACPIITGYGTCMLAEFNYDNKVCESLPCKQNAEGRIVYYMKKDILPNIYWNLAVQGKWHMDHKWFRKFNFIKKN